MPEFVRISLGLTLSAALQYQTIKSLAADFAGGLRAP
jgi:hypothetical protein